VKTLYQLIGVEPSATGEEIRSAFHKEIARYHPDKVQHLGHEFHEIAVIRAAELTQAYRTLMNPSAREKYDATLGGSGGATAKAPTGLSSACPPSTLERAATSNLSAPPAVGQERRNQPPATVSDFVKRATLARFRDAALAVCDASMVDVRGFDAAYVCRPAGGLFKKGDDGLCLVGRLVPAVTPDAVEQAWPFGLRASADHATVCMMLMGELAATPKELTAAVSEQRRRSRTDGPIVVAVDFRDWNACVPVDTPPLVRAVLQRLQRGDR
jgi:DnaJ domain